MDGDSSSFLSFTGATHTNAAGGTPSGVRKSQNNKDVPRLSHRCRERASGFLSRDRGALNRPEESFVYDATRMPPGAQLEDHPKQQR